VSIDLLKFALKPELRPTNENPSFEVTLRQVDQSSGEREKSVIIKRIRIVGRKEKEKGEREKGAKERRLNFHEEKEKIVFYATTHHP